MIDWYHAKRFVEQATSLSMDALHLVIGALLFLGFSLLLRRPVTALQPWLAVLALALVNEGLDLWLDIWPNPAVQLGEGVKDLVVTMLIPTLILASARHLPQLYDRSAAPKRTAPPADER